MSDIQIVSRALAVSRNRLESAPDFRLYRSIVKQLEYLLSILEGSESDRSKLGDIIIGVYADREFDGSDQELFNSLKEAQGVAYKMENSVRT